MKQVYRLWVREFSYLSDVDKCNYRIDIWESSSVILLALFIPD